MRTHSLRWFLVLNTLLLLLFGWTLTEESPVTVRFARGACVAEVHGRRTATPCGELEPAWFGFYTASPSLLETVDPGLLDWIASRPAVSSAQVLGAQDSVVWSSSFSRSELVGWRFPLGRWDVRFSELGAKPGPATALRPLPVSGDVTISADLRRPETDIGLLLLDPSGQNGRLFVVSAQDGWATWWRWQGGQPDEPLVAVPFRRPVLSELQAVLRRLLRAHHAALLFIAAAWVYGRIFSGQSLLSDEPRRVRSVVLILALLTFLGTSLIADVILERIPHVQDSLTYLFQAQTLARGHLWAPAPPLPDAFAQEFMLVRGDRWIGKYPPGFPLLLAGGVLLGAPWMVNPLLATLTVPLLYALGRDLYHSRRLGLLAALLGTTSPFFLFLSGSFMSHTAELFWLTLMMVAWVRAQRAPTPRRWAVVAGLALGAAFITRQMAAVAVGGTFLGASLFPVQRFRLRLPQLILVALAALPFVLLLLGYQWAVTGDPFQDPRLLYWPYDRLGFGPGTGNNANLARYEEGGVITWYQDPDRPSAWHSVSRGLGNLLANLQELEVYLYGWLPIASLAFLWLLFLLARPRRGDWLLLATLGGLVAAHLPYWAHGIMYGPRYYFAALPALLLLTARGVQALAARFGTRAALGLLVLLIVGNLLINIPYQAYVDRGYNYVSRQSLERVTELAQTPALVFVATDEADWWDYGALFSANSPWLDGPIVVARDLGPARNAELAGHFPHRRVYRFDGETLRPIIFPG